ncbi:N-acetylglucosamine kinase [Neobacillus muris]|uniref:N-acetylglucosamine kinase n=1 Tax=Neobacillus muris TaxID=2941334 RepID=UPI002041F3A5|nr:BadF/BadG/BcrA/BcrD ATPase family protein [Neobacillus muris]
MNPIPILAIDGGGTCCRGALCDDDGRILAYAEEGPVNYQNIGIAQTNQNLTKLLQALLNQIGAAALEVERAIVGMAGIDTGQDYQAVKKILLDSFDQSGIRVDQLYLENDANMTLRGLADDEPGVLVIAGTGSICCGMNGEGRSIRVGGWGHLIGDEGSGYRISLAAIQHIFRTIDGQEEPSGIMDAVLSHLKLRTIQDLMNWVYKANSSINEMASLAPVIFDLADQGDTKAMEILSNASADLAHACRTAIKKLGLSEKPFMLILGGGILQYHPFVAGRLIQRLAKDYTFRYFILDKQPLYCALLYGLRKGKGVSKTIEWNCSQSLQDWQLRWKKNK